MSSEDIASQQAHSNEDRAHEVLVVHVTCLILAVVAVAMRFISRRIKSGYHADDWMCLFALVLTIGECTGVLLGSFKYGSAKHSWTLKDPDAVAKITIAVQELYNTGISCVKFSVLLLYHRVFPSHRLHICLCIVGAFIATYSFIQFLVILLQCDPVRGAWDTTIHAKCIKLMLELEVMGILNAITDIITVLLPMPLLWGLQMPLKKKIGTIATFLVGGFVCVVSVIRVPMEAGISLKDASYTDVTGCNWSFIELSIAIVCACLPTLRPLLRVISSSIYGSSSKSSENSDNPHPPTVGHAVMVRNPSSDNSDTSSMEKTNSKNWVPQTTAAQGYDVEAVKG